MSALPSKADVMQQAENCHTRFCESLVGFIRGVPRFCAIHSIEARKIGLIVVDCVREITAPFDPEGATDEFAKLCH